MKCPICNANLPDSANYCDRCAHEFNHAIPSTAPTGSPNHLPLPYSPSAGTRTATPQTPNALTGPVTRPTGLPAGGGLPLFNRHSKTDWMHRLMTKCIIVTVVTLAVAVIILLFDAWPGCLISASLLLYAVAGTAGCIAIQVPGVCGNLEQDMGADRASLLLNQIVNLSVVWEVFWLAAGLVCLSFSWWAVVIAEFVNLSALVLIAGGIIEEMDL